MDRWAFLRKLIREADVVIEIIDARDPSATRIQLAERWAGSNRLVIAVNKIDLLEKGARPVLPRGVVRVSGKDQSGDSRKRLLEAIRKRARKLPARGVVVGYPNVGKSTLINMLARRKAARVAPVAGTTTNIQWIRVESDILISDFPGVFPKGERKEELVRKGALDTPDPESYVHEQAERIIRNKILRRWIEEYFDIDLSDAKNSEDVLERIAKRRGLLQKGGEINASAAAGVLLKAMREAPQI